MKTTKQLFAFFALLVLPYFMFAQEQNPIKLEPDEPHELADKSLPLMPSAFLDGTELTLSYPLSTESQVMIIDQSTQSTVYTETFAATRSLNIDLEEEGLPDGSYTLRIYAFGKWWVGEFVLGDN